MAEKLLLAHGGGGRLARQLIERLIGPAVGGLDPALPDASPIAGTDEIVLTTDAYVVKPLFFRGGDIGSLSVHGTVNDLAVSGAEPLGLSLSLILEEGLDQEVLERVLQSAGKAARACGVRIVTGDTKVVARGEADSVFITTSGVGRVRAKLDPSGLRVGDLVLVSGCIGQHGIAVMSSREGIEFDTPVVSDSASVWPLVKALLDSGAAIRAMRDPTRGGVASALNELADASGVSLLIEESYLPVEAEVAAACEMLGLDPLSVANEGKLVAFFPAADAQKAMDAITREPLGRDASIVGEVTERREKAVYLRTRLGGERIVEMPYGEELPRIC
jgi:hydrogenase expression/formation protein HypE